MSGADATTRDVLARAEATWSHWGMRMATFGLGVCVDVVLRLVLHDLSVTPAYVAGLCLVLVAGLLAAHLHLVHGAGPATWAVPLLAIGAVGLMRLVPEGNSMGILVVLPAMWLGIDKRAAGVVATATGVLVLLLLPAVAYFGPGPAVWSRAVAISLVATVCALSLSWIAQQWHAHSEALVDQQRRLHDTRGRLGAGQALNQAVVGAVDVGLVALRRDGAYSSMNPHHGHFMDLAFPEGHRGFAGQTGWVFEADGTTFLPSDRMPTVRAMNGEEYNDYLIWVGEDPAQRRALAVSARRVEGDSPLASVLVYKDVTDLMRALKVKDDFVATVSHELRTPLTSILGYLDLAILDTPDQDPRRGYLVVVHRNARRLLRLVNDLLLTARTERGVLDLDHRPTDLSRVVDEGVHDASRRARKAGVTIEADVAPGLWVTGDRERLAQVIDNLVSNAVQYSHAGGQVRVTLAARHTEGHPEGTSMAELVVSDDGIGISEDDRRQLFTKFFRTQEAQQRAIQGVGLGLSISRAIIEGHAGTISVASEPGVGTSFTVRLPSAARPLDEDGHGLDRDHGPLGVVGS